MGVKLVSVRKFVIIIIGIIIDHQNGNFADNDFKSGVNAAITAIRLPP